MVYVGHWFDTMGSDGVYAQKPGSRKQSSIFWREGGIFAAFPDDVIKFHQRLE